MLRVDVSLDLGFHVVFGVGRLTVQQEGFIRPLHFTTHTKFQIESSFLLDVVVRLCPVIVNSICIPNSCIFHNIAKTGLLRCRLYRQRMTEARRAQMAPKSTVSKLRSAAFMRTSAIMRSGSGTDAPPLLQRRTVSTVSVSDNARSSGKAS